jgi:hypothetical protein
MQGLFIFSSASGQKERNESEKKHASLNNRQRRQICLWKQLNPRSAQEEVCQWAQTEFGLAEPPTQVTISRIFSKLDYYLAIQDEYILDNKIKMKVMDPQLDEAFANWIFQSQAQNVFLSGGIIRENGRSFAELLGVGEGETPTFSVGWLTSFQKRHGIKAFRAHGESGSADTLAIEVALPTPK